MQPYFFPYIGYFQLMAASDIFVSHDDVAYIKGGWVNRNRIVARGNIEWMTLPVKQGAHNLPINQRHYACEPRSVRRLFRRLEAAYQTAPHYGAAIALFKKVLGFEDTTVSRFNENLLRCVAAEIGITTPMRVSSELVKDDRLAGQDRVLDICHRLGATRYLNPPGGRGLYRQDTFEEKGLALEFLSPGPPSYQHDRLPVPLHLSMLDVMMFCGRDRVRKMLQDYTILTERSGAPG